MKDISTMNFGEALQTVRKSSKELGSRIKDKHTPRSHRGNKGHISGQKGYWFFEAIMEQKQSDESPRETLAISQKNVHQIRCSMNIRQ